MNHTQGFCWIQLMMGLLLMSLMVPACYQLTWAFQRHVQRSEAHVSLLQRRIAFYNLMQAIWPTAGRLGCWSLPHMQGEAMHFSQGPRWLQQRWHRGWSTQLLHTDSLHVQGVYPVVQWTEGGAVYLKGLPQRLSDQWPDPWILSNCQHHILVEPKTMQAVRPDVWILRGLRKRPASWQDGPWFASPLEAAQWFVAPDPHDPHHVSALFVRRARHATPEPAQAVLPGVISFATRTHAGHLQACVTLASPPDHRTQSTLTCYPPHQAVA